jgi:hypothetical protein
LDDQLEDQIRKALKIGYDLYKERGWIWSTQSKS